MRVSLWVTAALAGLPLLAIAGSDYIERVERKLSGLGYPAGAIDGYFDRQLEQAIRMFQSEHELPVDGRLTQQTQAAIMAAQARPAQAAPVPAPAAPPPPVAAEPPPAPAAAPEPAARAEPAPVAVRAAPPRRSWPGMPSRTFGFLVEGAVEFGGDTVATVAFTDGTDQDIKTGQGVTLGGGVYLRPASAAPFDLRATVGYKYTTSRAENADIDLGRVVSELSARYWLPQNFWLGAGVVHHSNIELDLDRFGSGEFEDATGWQVELGWRYLALSYTGMDYTADTQEAPEFDASNFGLMLNWNF